MERRSKTFQTVLGEVTLDRAYYHCQQCGTGFCPRDRDLGLEGGSESAGIQRMCSLATAMASFDESQMLLRELAGVEVSAKRAERCAKRIGAEVAADERGRAEPIDTSAPLPQTFCLSMELGIFCCWYFLLWQQDRNIPFWQSRNVPLTTSRLERCRKGNY